MIGVRNYRTCSQRGCSRELSSITTPVKNSWRRDIIVIGGSAGGPGALRKLLAALPVNTNATILITLHVPADMPSVLPEMLSGFNGWKAQHPQSGQPLRPGVLYIAPPNLHLIVEPSRVLLSTGPRENRHRPAIDVLFRSAARAYGSRVAAIVLSGQLDDGAAGLMAVRMRGGLSIVQDPQEAAVPEMPENALKYAGADYVLPVREIADLIVSISGEDLPLPQSQEPAVTQEQRNNEQRIDEAREESVTQRETKGKPSPFACPECHGVLFDENEGNMMRFRCRVGHAYTADALRVALTEASENALWIALRALEEKAALMRRLADKSGPRLGGRYLEEASGFEQHAQTILKILENSERLSEKESDEQRSA
jgi:two-component system chemotaxis response regulator CheB